MFNTTSTCVNIFSRRLFLRRLFGFFLLFLLGISAARAEDAPPRADIPIPRFFGEELRAERPDLGQRKVLRFLTSSDYPPFQFLDGSDSPAGFNADLARAICGELELSCTLQAFNWDSLLDTLASGRADAVISGMRPTPDLVKRVNVSSVYFRLPARFMVKQDSTLTAPSPDALSGKVVAVVQGSAHEAYARAFFPLGTLKSFVRVEDAEAAVREGQADAMFGDGVTLSLWLNGSLSQGCCRFVGGPYFESRYFGEGMVIAVRKGDTRLLHAIDYALGTLESRGAVEELYLKWFPAGVY